MKSFQKALSPAEYEMICDTVNLRFKDPEEFVTPEALIVYEQGLLDEVCLLEEIKQEYLNHGFDKSIELPKRVYLSPEIIEHFRGKDCLPLSYDNINNIMHVAILPEWEERNVERWNNAQIHKHLVPIYYYVDNFIKLYGVPVFLLELPGYDLFGYIVHESIKYGASDITLRISSREAAIYYYVNNTRVSSRMRITRQQVDGICKLLQFKAGIACPDKYRKPVFFSIDLNLHYRGRVSMAFTHQGILATIHVIKNDLPLMGLSGLSIPNSAVDFIREIFTSDETGLRLIVGPAHCGKSTTIMAALYEKLSNKKAKTLSIEMPLEYKVDFMEQIECLTEEDINLASESLFRQNPDLVYITDLFDATAETAISAVNSGKAVYASLNANSITDSILRLHNMTGISMESTVQGVQSVIFQTLKISEGKFMIENRCLYFSKKFKAALLGLSKEAILKVLRKEEAKWA